MTCGHIRNNAIKIAPLELQIAYKEIVLKSQKDMEDARHIRVVAEENLDKELISKYKSELIKWMQKK